MRPFQPRKQSYHYGLSAIDRQSLPRLLLQFSVILRHEGSFTERFFTAFRMTIVDSSPCSALPRLTAAEGALSLSLMIKKQTIKACIFS
jgi:hypothetical protein